MVVSVESQQVKIKKPIKKYKKKNINLNINIKLYFKYAVVTIPMLFFLARLIVILPDLTLENNERQIPSVIELPGHKIDINNKDVNYNKYTTELYKTHIINDLDKISGLSIKYDISVNTILNVNKLNDLKDLYKNESILIPNENGFLHSVKERENLEDIAGKYNISISKLFSVNRLKSKNISNFDEIFIPVDSKDSMNLTKKYFLYPVRGYISKRFGYHTNSITGLTTLYEGVDFVPTNDKKVYVSKTGQISSMGYNANYGNYIFIDHSSGFRTLYAHLDSISAKNGDKVTQGDVIATIGSSGFTTKQKLFFCLLKGNKPVDPEKYLN